MAMQPPAKTSSAHMSTFLRGTHQFCIIGYSARKELGVRNTVRSGDFEAGGCTWALVCCFDVLPNSEPHAPRCHLASITLKLVASNKHVIAKASLRIDDPTPGKKGRRPWPPAVWRSGEAHNFPATSPAESDESDDDDDDDDDEEDDDCSWKLPIPDAFRESLYVKDDRLTIHCTVHVLLPEKVHTAATNCFASVVPPPSISQDLRKLLHLDKSKSTGTPPFTPDVTFIVEQTEIQAHRLVLAMRSPVFAAELFGEMKESAMRARIMVDDMSVATFKTMLYFIYTDELPSSLEPKNDNVGDLLVAADRYDLERLRLMCEKILADNLDAASAMTTLMLVHGRESCRHLEASCIEYMASVPDVHAAVVATEEYKELKERCGPFVTDVLEKVSMRALATLTHNSSSSSSSKVSSRQQPHKSASMFNSSEVFTGSHEFRIPNFSAVQKMFGVGRYIESTTFHIGGSEWMMHVYPSGYQEEGYIGLFLREINKPETTTGWVLVSFKIDDPSGESSPVFRWAENYEGLDSTYSGVKQFMDVTTSKLYYIRNGGSLTIQCDVEVGKAHSYTTSTTAVGATTAIIPPPSNIACHLEGLLVSEQRSDVKFQVQDSELRAHELIIAMRSPILHQAISSAPDKDNVRIDDIDVPVMEAILHFIYTDELPLMGSSNAEDATAVTRDMLVAADRFGLKRMKAMCENTLCERVTGENVVATLELADRLHCNWLKEFCIDHILQPHVLKEAVETRSFKDLKTTSPWLLEEILIKISKLSPIDL